MRNPLFQQSLQEERESKDLHQLTQGSLVEVQRMLIIRGTGGIPAEVQANKKEVGKERGIVEGKKREMKTDIIVTKGENKNTSMRMVLGTQELRCICFIPTSKVDCGNYFII